MNRRLPLPIQVSRGPHSRGLVVGLLTLGFAAAMLAVVLFHLCLGRAS